MKNICVLLVCVITIINSSLYAQDFSYTSWKQLSMQNIDVVDDFQLFNTNSNPAIASINEGFEIMLLGKNSYSIASFNSLNGILNYNFINGLSINYSIIYTGINDLYLFGNSVGISKKIFNNTSIGIRLKESKFYNEEIDNGAIISPEIGLHTYLNKSIAFAISYRNPFSFTSNKNQYSLSTGLKYTYIPLLTIMIQVDKESELPMVYKLGYSGTFNNYLTLFLGVDNSKTPIHALLTVSFRKSKVHLGCSYHEQLGISTNIGIQRYF